MMMKTATLLAGAGMLLLSCQQSQATLTLDFGEIFSNTTHPGGSPPWLTAALTDKTGGVELVVTASGLVNLEFMDSIFLNYRNASSATLTINQTAGVGNTGIGYSPDAYKADGDGRYDIRIDWPDKNNASGRFVAGSTATFFITSTASTFSENDFFALSAPEGGWGPYYAAAHIQGIGSDGSLSTWVAVPEPSTYIAGGLLLIPLLVQLRRWNRAK